MSKRPGASVPLTDRPRCRWAATDPLLARYHDREWGQPIRTDAGHLERMSLEVFQCGLSWKIVLVKRPAFRELFEGFDPQRVARYGRREVGRLCRDSSIIRNRRKIEAVVENAKSFLEIAEQSGSYCRWFHRLPAGSSGEQAALYPLFRETFAFMGPETTKCYLMGVGKIAAAHDKSCWAAGASA